MYLFAGGRGHLGVSVRMCVYVRICEHVRVYMPKPMLCVCAWIIGHMGTLFCFGTCEQHSVMKATRLTLNTASSIACEVPC